MIARSTLWGTVQFGEAFFLLSKHEQRAVAAHEQGHIHHRHAWTRLKWIVTLRVRHWEEFLAMCEVQEMEADRYAVEQGHAAGLISFLFRLTLRSKTEGYPTAQQRLEAIYVR